MTRKTIVCSLLCFTLGTVTSCNDMEVENDKDLVIIEPPYMPLFQFNEQGMPYRFDSPTLTPEMQQNLRTEVIGYGWQWMQTFEILPDGFVSQDDFYESIIGQSPVSYYFKSDRQMIRYFYSDALNQQAHLTQGFTMDPVSGILSDGSAPSSLFPWTVYLRIWSIYQLNGRWYIDAIEPLCQRADANGESRIVWGSSHYYRMSDAELLHMQKQHAFDYSQVN